MFFKIIQLLLSVALITIILLQAKGTGLGSTFGGSSQTYHSKRGVEKAVFYTTIILAVLFAIVSIINLVV